MQHAVPPAVLHTLLPQLQAVADTASKQGADTAVPHVRVTCCADDAPLLHSRQCVEREDRAQALTGLPVPPGMDDWRPWPPVMQDLVREVVPYLPRKLPWRKLPCSAWATRTSRTACAWCAMACRSHTRYSTANNFTPPNSPSTRMSQNGAGLRATLQKGIALGARSATASRVGGLLGARASGSAESERQHQVDPQPELFSECDAVVRTHAHRDLGSHLRRVPRAYAAGRTGHLYYRH